LSVIVIVIHGFDVLAAPCSGLSGFQDTNYLGNAML
jgi:hypothetical protein